MNGSFSNISKVLQDWYRPMVSFGGRYSSSLVFVMSMNFKSITEGQSRLLLVDAKEEEEGEEEVVSKESAPAAP